VSIFGDHRHGSFEIREHHLRALPCGHADAEPRTRCGVRHGLIDIECVPKMGNAGSPEITRRNLDQRVISICDFFW
jgi:hypothetical protein